MQKRPGLDSRRKRRERQQFTAKARKNYTSFFASGQEKAAAVRCAALPKLLLEKRMMRVRATALDPSAIEGEIHERAAAAKIRLRFDKSVQRLLEGVKTDLAGIIPDGQAILFTVTAPIRRRAKTAAAIAALVRGGLAGGEMRGTIEDNRVQIRRVVKVPARMPKIVGFVHNPESDADALLALAEDHLRGRGKKLQNSG